VHFGITAGALLATAPPAHPQSRAFWDNGKNTGSPDPQLHTVSYDGRGFSIVAGLHFQSQKSHPNPVAYMID
jgi:hypothetical protein